MIGRKIALTAAAALALAGCEGGGTAYYSPYYDSWDYGFGYGIYDVHYDGDIDIDRPDRPVPPSGIGGPRPMPPIANAPGAGLGPRPTPYMGGGGGPRVSAGGGGMRGGGGGGRRMR